VSKEEKKETQLFRGQVAALCASPGITQACTGCVEAKFDFVGKWFLSGISANQLALPKLPKGR